MALLLRSVALAPFWYPAVASAVEHSLVQYPLQVKCKVGVVGKNPSDSYDFLAIFKHRLSAESTGLWPARRPMAGLSLVGPVTVRKNFGCPFRLENELAGRLLIQISSDAVEETV